MTTALQRVCLKSSTFRAYKLLIHIATPLQDLGGALCMSARRNGRPIKKSFLLYHMSTHNCKSYVIISGKNTLRQEKSDKRV